MSLSRHPRAGGDPVSSNSESLITEHIDLWTSSIKARNTQGRGSSKKRELYGIKKLRELILELAMRGKLVPQDPSDEPASELLKRIAAEKGLLLKDGKIKKQKPLPEISDEEKLLDLPRGWEIVRLGVLTKKLTDGSHNPPRDSGEGYPMLSGKNVNFGEIDFKNPSRYVTEEDYEQETLRTDVMPGDVLLTIVGSIGRSAVVPEVFPQFVLQRSVAVIQTLVNSKYLSLHFVAPRCLNYFDANAKGTAQKGIYLGQLSQMPILVPPLDEQHRIVAKVDELMALCDQLEQQTESSLDAHNLLVDTLLASLLKPAEGSLTDARDANELSDNWARLADHFDTLITTNYAVEQLKQTILQLAVMGKLVPQDPNDEPASELLKRITAEKEQLIKDKKIKKQKPLPEITQEEKPFELPDGWEWKRLGDLSYIFSGNSFKSSDFNETGGTRVIKITNAGVGEIIETNDFLPEEFLEQHKGFRVQQGDLILALTRPYISTGLKVSACPPLYHNSLLNQRVAAIRVFTDTEFLYQYMQSDYVLGLYQRRFGGSGLQPNLKMGDVTDLVIPVPPVKEQHRIVAKVDQLMALCDQLKTRLNTAQTTQLQLADTVVDEALN